MPWLELRTHTTRDHVAQVESGLEQAGALSITLEDSEDTPIFEPALGETPLWANTKVTGLFEADSDTKAIEQMVPLPPQANRVWHVVEDKDWEREWMKNYQPIECAVNLWVCPSWCEPPKPHVVNLMLDPGLAFGTGTHPTTFMCLQWLAEQNLKGKTLLDYGCGSGILGIAGLLLGADSAVGIDIDPQALIATQDNAKRNSLPAERFPVYLPGNTPKQQYQVVIANILAGPLVELAPQIKPLLMPGASLCLSGVLATQAQTVMSAYSDIIDFAPIKTQGEWACLYGDCKE